MIAELWLIQVTAESRQPCGPCCFTSWVLPRRPEEGQRGTQAQKYASTLSGRIHRRLGTEDAIKEEDWGLEDRGTRKLYFPLNPFVLSNYFKYIHVLCVGMSTMLLCMCVGGVSSMHLCMCGSEVHASMYVCKGEYHASVDGGR